MRFHVSGQTVSVDASLRHDYPLPSVGLSTEESKDRAPLDVHAGFWQTHYDEGRRFRAETAQ